MTDGTSGHAHCRHRLCRYGLFLFTLLLTSACADTTLGPPLTPSTVDTFGPGAAHIAAVWWLMFAFSAIVFVLVIGLLGAAVLRGRRATDATPPEKSASDTGRNWIIRGGIAMPVVVLGIVFGFSIYTSAVMANPQGQAAVKIKVVAHQWWWQVIYPDQGITTANEIHIPVGTPVQIQLDSADVIHSFWVPELDGKMDVIPTRINVITLRADRAGVYRGECAEFCGLQHAHMGFMVVAEGSGDFANWVAAQQKPAAVPGDPSAMRGQQVFMTAGCMACHTIRGLNDTGVVRSIVAPDLTHLAGRLTIAGASRDMSQSNLAGWVAGSQHLKPGSLMPTMYLGSQDLLNLVAYLQTLR